MDELGDWDLAPPLILADGAYGEVGEFRLGLKERELAYVVQVSGTTSVHAEDVVAEAVPYAGRGGGRWCAPGAWRCGSGRSGSGCRASRGGNYRYRELKDALGLDHFQGRSWRGWYHHLTLVSAAHCQRRLPRSAAWLHPSAAPI